MRLDLEGGKYTIVLAEYGSLKALRYGKSWRDLCGDNLVYYMAIKIEELKALAITVADGNFNQADVIAEARRLSK